jgi:hypothetical protein
VSSHDQKHQGHRLDRRRRADLQAGQGAPPRRPPHQARPGRLLRRGGAGDAAAPEAAAGEHAAVPRRDRRRTLVYLADQACVRPPVWLCRAAALDRPDQLVFDLDPSGDAVAEVRRATRIVGELLDDSALRRT